MDPYITGSTVRRLREARGLTQAELAAALAVSDKAVSKWETGRGLPDITLLEPLAEALGVSPAALMTGTDIRNGNTAGNIARMKLYVCPVCGNVLTALGEAEVSCCGVTLPPLEAEPSDADHALSVEEVEDEYFVSCPHPMTKEHYLSFIAAVRDDGYTFVKLYPEGNAEARFPRGRVRWFWVCCNRHGLYRVMAPRKPLTRHPAP